MKKTNMLMCYMWSFTIIQKCLNVTMVKFKLDIKNGPWNDISSGFKKKINGTLQKKLHKVEKWI